MGRVIVHRDGDVCRFRRPLTESETPLWVAAYPLMEREIGARDAAEVDLTEVDFDVAQHRLIARDNPTFSRR